jgi:prepilin-type N-terminal cleavage/methylation domain-containing protein
MAGRIAGRLAAVDIQGQPLKKSMAAYAHSQGGYTLVEVVVAVAIGAILMTALTSVILTATKSATIATSRIEASGQIRNFEFFAYDDFALSGVPVPSGCGTVGNPCTTQPIVLSGKQASNSVTPVMADYSVTYTWVGSAFLDRQVGPDPASAVHMATNVTDFSWYVDVSAPHPTVVVNLTVTVQSYSQSQTWLFYPRVNP